MSYETTSYMLVGMRYVEEDLVESAVEWSKSNHAGFADAYEKQLQVANIMPKYQADLDALQEQATDNFKDYLGEQGMVIIREHRGFDYIGYPVSTTVGIDDDVLAEFCLTVKEKNKSLTELLGKTGKLMSAHNYS